MRSTGYLSTLGGLLCLLAGPALSADAEHATLDGQAKIVPADVATFTTRERQCRAWMAIEISNEATDRAAQRALSDLRCDRLSGDMAALRHKYAQSPGALRGLDAAGGVGL
jgi:hypothetical protein